MKEYSGNLESQQSISRPRFAQAGHVIGYSNDSVKVILMH